MTIDQDEPHTEAESAGHKALAAAGEAAAFFAGAPIAGAGDAAVGLGDAVAEREARLEEAITGKPAADGPVPKGIAWGWLVIGALVAIGALVWALKG